MRMRVVARLHGTRRYLLWWDVQRNCPQVHLLIVFNTGQDEKETLKEEEEKKKKKQKKTENMNEKDSRLQPVFIFLIFKKAIRVECHSHMSHFQLLSILIAQQPGRMGHGSRHCRALQIPTLLLPIMYVHLLIEKRTTLITQPYQALCNFRYT